MLRITLLVCVSLIFIVTAKPYKPSNKLSGDASQNSVMSDDKAEIPWGVEVEPPEDMDKTDYDINPKMMIWSKMDGEFTQPKKAEVDMDEVYHPSMADLLKAQSFNLDAVSAADLQEEPLQEEAIMTNYEQPEQDKDDINHPDFSEVALNGPEEDWNEYKASEDVPVGYSEPEKDEDDLYHRDNQPAPVQIREWQHEVQDKTEVRVHLQPEEDMDDLYHKDLPQPIPYQVFAEAAPPADWPSQRKYSEPEEDLDEIYHR